MRTVAVFILLAALPTQAVNLVSRSAGLEIPLKEAGHTELEIGDINGDGHLDIVSVGDHGSPFINSDEHGIMVWLGDGGDTWPVVQTGEFGYGGCAIGDLNNDGFMDLAWGIHHDYASSGIGDKLMGAALGDGTGSGWTQWDDGLASGGEDWGMFATDLADFDLDGYLDIVCESFGADNGVRVYANHGTGTWSQEWLIDGWNSNYTVETGDFNADGLMDFVCTRWGTQVYFNQGGFNFNLNQAGIPGLNYISVDCGDFNNDGMDDIVCSLGSDSGVRVYSYNTGTDQWEDNSTGLPAGGVYVDCVQFGFIDDDDNLDLVLYDDPSGTVYLGDGAGAWTPDATWTMPGSGDASAMRVDGDVDHDGREDIAIQGEMVEGMWERNQLRLYSPWQEPAVLSTRLITPDGGEFMYSGSIREVRWLTAVPSIQGQALIDIDLSTAGPSGPWIGIAQDIPDNGTYQWTVPPGESSDCRLRITAHTATESAEAVSADDFTIMYQLGMEEQQQAPFPPLVLRIFPNPSSGIPDIRVTGLDREPALLLVFDISGRLLMDRELNPEEQNPYQLANDGAPLPSGVYLVTVNQGNRAASSRLVLLAE
ncbi:MAG: T9SS type A sorting domain-containing protein [Candidatus Fermentibacteraceae bacterium]|nr:T9SS type A sorting domain-containing protein [Candidatus Fermentibacteraceae bacterium]MBN2609832.1 T9SS type A sorting domain-containing protein [Candidatus Fermentibacteraceae bacterium]